VICDNALVGGLALDQKPVGRDVVLEVCRDFGLETCRRDVGLGESRPGTFADDATQTIRSHQGG
jgi:hypothetical protein